MPGLDRRSDIYVWLPPGYRRGRERYPVVYLHDGGNLFDARTSFAGATWRADEAFTWLHSQGVDAIAVGVPCSPDRRIEEYTPYLGQEVLAAQPDLGAADADSYVTFLTDHLKPWVDATVRTRPEREHTLTAGSSMGGVVSMHAWVRRPDVFGGIGAFSTAFWVPGEQHLLEVEQAIAAPHPPTRFYLDVGGRETPDDPTRQLAYRHDTERVVAALQAADVPVRYTYDSAAYHFETAWAARLPGALRWLLQEYAVRPPGAG
nr:alpha/beta hydrolase-fold protein [Ornithinimicrobium sp. F0845]